METHLGILGYVLISLLILAILLVFVTIIAGLYRRDWRWRSAGLIMGILLGFIIGFAIGTALDEPDKLGPPFIGFFVSLIGCIITGYIIGHLIDRTRSHGGDR